MSDLGRHGCFFNAKNCPLSKNLGLLDYLMENSIRKLYHKNQCHRHCPLKTAIRKARYLEYVGIGDRTSRKGKRRIMGTCGNAVLLWRT